MSFGFEKLDVWKKSLDYANFVISLSETINSSRRHLRLIDQLALIIHESRLLQMRGIDP